MKVQKRSVNILETCVVIWQVNSLSLNLVTTEKACSFVLLLRFFIILVVHLLYLQMYQSLKTEMKKNKVLFFHHTMWEALDWLLSLASDLDLWSKYFLKFSLNILFNIFPVYSIFFSRNKPWYRKRKVVDQVNEYEVVTKTIIIVKADISMCV